MARRNPFTSLPEDIRNQIYEYFRFSEREDEQNSDKRPSARNLALACRQAKQEFEEKCHRRFVVYLTKIKALYLSEMGDEVSYPQELASKHDLAGVESLKVIIAGRIPLPDYDGLPEAIDMLLTSPPMPMQELVIRFTDIWDIQSC